jgi:prevent-host-death family protein
MSITTISSREFNQDVSGAKRAAESGPVVITDRGQPAFVLLRHDAYRQLVGKGPSIADLLAQPESDDLEFDPPRMGRGNFKPVELG